MIKWRENHFFKYFFFFLWYFLGSKWSLKDNQRRSWRNLKGFIKEKCEIELQEFQKFSLYMCGRVQLQGKKRKVLQNSKQTNKWADMFLMRKKWWSLILPDANRVPVKTISSFLSFLSVCIIGLPIRFDFVISFQGFFHVSMLGMRYSLVPNRYNKYFRKNKVVKLLHVYI